MWCRMCLVGKGGGPRLPCSVRLSYHLRAAKAVLQTTEFPVQKIFAGGSAAGSEHPCGL
ncbi:hypothetical protein SUBVAR_06860 [Subdoligranulum variabile DSM 15176]|uniref:Uncharacterized protein n=1 Tax=Subdoligranulum variabile DSM 15176 TaxID=411471 RepID=D1PR33_9FIRM|nr:hypothetical protein SUBVAR_06860 [Subdoligranulum variabile DSM 15176]